MNTFFNSAQLGHTITFEVECILNMSSILLLVHSSEWNDNKYIFYKLTWMHQDSKEQNVLDWRNLQYFIGIILKADRWNAAYLIIQWQLLSIWHATDNVPGLCCKSLNQFNQTEMKHFLRRWNWLNRMVSSLCFHPELFDPFQCNKLITCREMLESRFSWCKQLWVCVLPWLLLPLTASSQQPTARCLIESS